MDKSNIPITVDLLISLGFVETECKIGRRFYIFVHGGATLDIVLHKFSNRFEFISFSHQLFEIESWIQLEILVLGLTGKKLETWKEV